jgi:magnesium transporter
MIITQKDKITWFDVLFPTKEDIEFVRKEFGLHPLIAMELEEPSAMGKAEFYDHYLFAVIHFPFYDSKKNTSRPVEIDIVASRDKVATIRYEEFPPLEEFASKCEEIPGFSSHCLGDTPAHFIYRLFEYLYSFAMRELQHINDKISKVEEKIFSRDEIKIIREISFIKRDILDFGRIIFPLEIVISSMASKGPKLYGKDLAIYFEDLERDFEKVKDRIRQYKDTIDALETTNQALISSHIDEITKILSVIAFLLAPFTVIGALFQINTVFTPIIGIKGDWWIISSIMMLGSIILFLIFRKKKWL